MGLLSFSYDVWRQRDPGERVQRSQLETRKFKDPV